MLKRALRWRTRKWPCPAMGIMSSASSSRWEGSGPRKLKKIQPGKRRAGDGRRTVLRGIEPRSEGSVRAYGEVPVDRVGRGAGSDLALRAGGVGLQTAGDRVSLRHVCHQHVWMFSDWADC